MISLTNHDFQWGRSEVVIIYPPLAVNGPAPDEKRETRPMAKEKKCQNVKIVKNPA